MSDRSEPPIDTPWHVSEAACAWLTEALRTQPKATGCGAWALGASALCSLYVCADVLAQAFFAPAAVLATLSVATLLWLTQRGKRWRRTFKPEREGLNRRRITAPAEPRSPRLTCSVLPDGPVNRFLLIDFDIKETVTIDRGMPALLLPEFDARLGIKSAALVRALIGSDLAERLVKWSAVLTVHDSVIRIRLTPTMDMFNAAQQVCAPFGAFADRLADPTPALARIASTDTLFHATLAWCVLRERVPTPMALLEANLGTELDAERVELLRLIHAGTSPFELPVDWPARAQIFRGMLSSVEPKARHESALCAELLKQVPTDAAGATALFDMLDAANAHARLRDASPLMTRLSDCLAEHGDAETLAWLAQRTATGMGKQADALAGRITARLHARQGGRLALSDDPIQGALSDGRAGDMSLVVERAPSLHAGSPLEP